MSFPCFDRAVELVVWPGDLAVLMIGVAARQGASRTAAIQAGLSPRESAGSDTDMQGDGARSFASLDGAFDSVVAASLTRWSDEPGGAAG